ncbi:hypothetical protein [Actinomadura rugatobispora]|uniref:Uncharacterized protein n=1 Tax=Actinomadura rugatobispora TaxID=1994 RepID=A0ABW0ZUH8_9ACTN|nr:hypothetical protein GCM10010200_077100 [Actinomadura rugatobispora]
MAGDGRLASGGRQHGWRRSSAAARPLSPARAVLARLREEVRGRERSLGLTEGCELFACEVD